MAKHLEVLRKSWQGCTKCSLHKDRKGPQIVFGEGNPNTELLFVSSHPNEDDAESHMPMSGPRGDFFAKMMEAIQIDPQDCYFTTLVACRPIVRIPATDTEPEQIKTASPAKEHIEACRPRVLEIIYQVDPRVIVALGEPAWRFFNGHKRPGRVKTFAESVNQLHDWEMPGRIEPLRYPVMTTLDPQTIFSNPSMARHGPVVSAMDAVRKAKQYVEWVKRQEKST